MTSNEKITVQGVVTALSPSAKDDARVAVVTEAGAEYRVVNKGAGVDLVDHVSMYAEITGTASPLPQAEGQDEEPPAYSMLVRNYRLIDGEYESP